MKYLIADGLRVKVDNEDFDRFKDFLWHIKWRTPNHPYVFRYKKRPEGHEFVSTHRRIKLHSAILPPTCLGLTPDHKNGDPLDNRRKNLRLATQSQQGQNSRHHNGKKYKGVTYCPTVHGKYQCNVPWRARIRVNGKLISLGFYANPEQAARAYNRAAVKYFGEFAALNHFPRRKNP
jgi:hypothetical protein